LSTFGPAYDDKLDGERINKQQARIRNFMLNAGWKTLGEIEGVLNYPQASISAQLRHLRKRRFGSFIVDKQRRGAAWEYKVSPPKEETAEQLSFFK
jgi:Fic family protein